MNERKSLEEQLLQAQKMEAVGRLAGGVAHDFNNLLTVILGNCNMLIRNLNEADPIKEELEEIRESAARATSLTRQLLAFSRKQIFSPKIINLNTVVDQMQKMLSRVIGEDVSLAINLAQNLGQIEADPSQIEQVILNLVINARDAMPEGGQLTLETSQVVLDEHYTSQHLEARPGRYVMVSVADNGVGMDRETQRRIFEPFFTTKEQGKGTGLGLSTVYGIVRQSGGNIWVYSEPGHGTTFKIYFPLVSGPVSEEQLPTAPAKSFSGTETILVVEDEDGVRRLARKILTQQGYQVLEARHGIEALSIYEQHNGRIDLLLTDTIMPKMNGHELAEKINKLQPGIKILYTSGYTDRAIVENGVLKTQCDFLGKPFSPEALAKKVREVLDRVID